MIKKLFFAAVLLVCAQAVMAENVLYAQVEGTDMTLKYGEKPDDSGDIKYYQFDGTAGWNSSFMTTIKTADQKRCETRTVVEHHSHVGYLRSVKSMQVEGCQ